MNDFELNAAIVQSLSTLSKFLAELEKLEQTNSSRSSEQRRLNELYTMIESEILVLCEYIDFPVNWLIYEDFEEEKAILKRVCVKLRNYFQSYEIEAAHSA
jgi:hypothetical protein